MVPDTQLLVFPSTAAFLDKLSSLTLSRCGLTGSIPDSFSALSKLAVGVPGHVNMAWVTSAIASALKAALGVLGHVMHACLMPSFSSHASSCVFLDSSLNALSGTKPSKQPACMLPFVGDARAPSGIASAGRSSRGIAAHAVVLIPPHT
jgi:hypothetical protein